MKHLILLLIILIGISIQPQAKTKSNYGYLIVISVNGGKPKVIKTTDVKLVNDTCNKYLYNDIDVNKVFTSTNNYFLFETQTIYVYCERKRAEYKRNKLKLYKLK